MAAGYSKKRKAAADTDLKGKPKKLIRKFKKQTDYNSDSSDDDNNNTSPRVATAPDQDFQGVNLQDSENEEELDTADLITASLSDDEQEEEEEATVGTLPNSAPSDTEEATDASSQSNSSDSDSDSETNPTSNPNLTKKRKRNDPTAFAQSISKILSSKLSTRARTDPVLARSITAQEASKTLIDQALEKKARSKLKEEKKVALEKGRVRDVLGVSTAFDAANRVGDGVKTGSGEVDGGSERPSIQKIMEEEKRLRKTAQRGVVKLFNAVRAAQVKGEEATREARVKGLVGHGRREEKVNEMSKKGFLELIAGGGGGLKAGGVEEA